MGRCPACALSDGDREGVHLLAWDDGEWLHFCRCMAGHEENDVMAALGWETEDRRIVPREETIPGRPPRPRDHRQTWTYRNAKGSPALVKTKEWFWAEATAGTDREPAKSAGWKKRFVQKAPDGKPLGERGQKLLYDLPEVIRAKALGETIWVNEGEKACDRMRSLGAVATCQPNGAGEGPGFEGKWTTHHTALLAGARRVVVVADRDRPNKRGLIVGEQYARYVASQLLDVVDEVEIVQSRTAGAKDDAWDHLDAGHGLDAFVPRPDLLPPLELETYAFGDDFTPVVLEHVVAPYLPKGKCVLLDADSGVGKTTMCCQWAAALSRGVHPLDANEILEGGPVKTLYLHTGEDASDEVETVYRANLGVPGMMRFVRDEAIAGLSFDKAGLRMLKRTIQREGYGLVIVDALFYFIDKLVGDGNNFLDAIGVLQDLNDVARSTGCVFWNIRHTVKGSIGKAASDLGMGSAAFRAKHRGQLVVRKHPEKMGVVVVTDEKGSLLNRQGEAFMFRRQGNEVQYLLDEHNPFDKASAGDQLAARSAKLDVAKQLLRDRLTGEWVATSDVLRVADGMGIGKRTIEKARSLLGVQHRTVAVGEKNVTYLHIPPPFKDPYEDE